MKQIYQFITPPSSYRNKFNFKNFSIGAGMFMLGFLLILPFSLFSQTTILSEDFATASGSTAPTGWTQSLFDGSPGFDSWRFNNPANRTINAPVSGTFAIFDSDYYSRRGKAEDVALVSPAFDASAFPLLYLQADMYFAGGYGGAMYIEVFDGNNWTTVSWSNVSTSNAASVYLDISSAAGDYQYAQVRFRWTGNWSWFWALDNILISGDNFDDNDGDGVSDELDQDDDNDGIPDALEGSFSNGCYDLVVFTGDLTGNIYELNIETRISSLKTTSPYVTGVINALSANPDQELIYYGSGTLLYYWNPDTDTHGILADLAGQITGTLESGGSSYYNGNIYIATEPSGGGNHIDIYKVPLAADGLSVEGTIVSLNPPVSGGYGDIIVTSEGDQGTIYGSTTTGFWSYDIASTTFNNFGSNGNTYQLGATPDGSLWSVVGTTVQRIDKSGNVFGSTFSLATEASDMTGPFGCPQVEVDQDTDGDGIIDAFDLDSDNDGIPDLVEAGGEDTNGDGLVDGRALDGSLLLDLDGDGWSDTYDSDPLDNTISGIPSNLGNLDMDGDGISNFLDLDSDNDGMLDIIEANGTDNDNNGQIDDASGSNGYSNSLDPADGGTPYMFAQSGSAITYVSGSSGLAADYVDTDTDGVPDFLDIDADNDGILDYIEAQASGSANIQAFYPPAASYDIYGLSTAFGSYQAYANDHTTSGGPAYGISPYDHDGDGIPDYLDTDSDNDGRTDQDEAWDGIKDTDLSSDYSCSTDQDGDGLLSCFDADDSDANIRINANDPPDDNGYEVFAGDGEIVSHGFAALDGQLTLLYDVFPNNKGDDAEVQPDWRDTGCANSASIQYPLTETDGLFVNDEHVLNTSGQLNGIIRSYEACEDLIETGWTYYYDPMNSSKIIFAIAHGSNTTPIEYVELRRDDSNGRTKTEQKATICSSNSHPGYLAEYRDLSVYFTIHILGTSTWGVQNPNMNPLDGNPNSVLKFNWAVYDDYDANGNIVQNGNGWTRSGYTPLITASSKSLKVEWYIETDGVASEILGCALVNDHEYDPKIHANGNSTSAGNYGSFVMARDWFVKTENDSALTAPVKVRFYYDPADYAQCVNDADSFALANSASLSGAVWFKIDQPFENSDINPDNGLQAQEGYTIMDVEKYGVEQGKTYVQFQNISSFSGGGMIIDADPVLPVEWQDVWVDPAMHGADVKWVTASELNTDYYSIERSVYGNLFAEIGRVPSAGENGQGASYAFPDANIPPLNLDRLYYRIKEVDKNGMVQFSNVVELQLPGASEIQMSLYPNPARSQLRLVLLSPEEPVQEINILDGVGRDIWSSPGGDYTQPQEIELDLANWANGVYFVRVLTENYAYTQKFVKK